MSLVTHQPSPLQSRRRARSIAPRLPIQRPDGWTSHRSGIHPSSTVGALRSLTKLIVALSRVVRQLFNSPRGGGLFLLHECSSRRPHRPHLWRSNPAHLAEIWFEIVSNLPTRGSCARRFSILSLSHASRLIQVQPSAVPSSQSRARLFLRTRTRCADSASGATRCERRKIPGVMSTYSSFTCLAPGFCALHFCRNI